MQQAIPSAGLFAKRTHYAHSSGNLGDQRVCVNVEIPPALTEVTYSLERLWWIQLYTCAGQLIAGFALLCGACCCICTAPAVPCAPAPQFVQLPTTTAPKQLHSFSGLVSPAPLSQESDTASSTTASGIPDDVHELAAYVPKRRTRGKVTVSS